MTQDRGLLLIGHGSAGRPAPFGALAAAVRAYGLYDDVSRALVKQGPPLAEALDTVSSARVDVLPLFLGNGHYTRSVIPAALGLEGRGGLDGPITLRDGRTLTLLPPAGHHPRMPDVVANCAATTALDAGFDPASTSLLLVAHGSRRGDGSEAGRRIAAAISANTRFADVALAFLEEFPHLGQWRKLTHQRDVLVQPLMMAVGAHLERDIPALLGLAQGERGPAEIDGRRIALSGPLGDGIGLLEIVNGWCPTNN